MGSLICINVLHFILIAGKKVNPCDEIQGTNSIKENLHNNDKKSIGHNLSLEPQRMKRSKKAGGYNLRKSLAWDKAFFTEEGILWDCHTFTILVRLKQSSTCCKITIFSSSQVSLMIQSYL